MFEPLVREDVQAPFEWTPRHTCQHLCEGKTKSKPSFNEHAEAFLKGNLEKEDASINSVACLNGNHSARSCLQVAFCRFSLGMFDSPAIGFQLRRDKNHDF